MKVFCVAVLLSSMLFGQVLYEEHFTGGAAQLTWEPWVVYTEMEVVNDPTSPGGDSWAGSVSNDSAPIACSYSGEYGLVDYQVEAWIFTTVTAGPMGSYNGICIRIDTATGVNAQYQLVSDFDSSNRLLLRHITGATPTIIREWLSAEIPGGVPASSSWHKLKVKVIADSLWAYYDDTELPGCPFINTLIDKGYFGIYFFNMLGGSTLCDDIIASAPTGISEHGSQSISTFSVYPNPFTNTTTIRYTIHDSGYMMENQELRIYDASGRIVRSFDPASCIVDQVSMVAWDGRDAAGKVVAPGVYFIADDAGTALHKVVRLR